MTTNRYVAGAMTRKAMPAKKKLLPPNEQSNTPFVTRNELENFSERILDSFRVIFTALDEYAEQSAYNTETLESLVSAIEDLNKENEKRHNELMNVLDKIEKMQRTQK